MNIQDNILDQTDSVMNKPDFLIHQVRKTCLTATKIYNHLLKIVLKEYTPMEHNGRFMTNISEIGLQISQIEIKKYLEVLQKIFIEQLNKYNKNDRYNGASFSILGSFVMHPRGFVEFSMDTLFLDHLKEVKENNKNLIYTALEEKFMKRFNSKHSLNLYELFKSNLARKQKTEFEMTLDDLLDYLNLKEKKSYLVLSNFRNKVLKIAVDELEDRTDLGIFYKDYTTMKLNKQTNKYELKECFWFHVETSTFDLLNQNEFKKCYTYWYREIFGEKPFIVDLFGNNRPLKVRFKKSGYIEYEMKKFLGSKEISKLKELQTELIGHYMNPNSQKFQCQVLKKEIEDIDKKISKPIIKYEELGSNEAVNVWSHLYSSYKSNPNGVYSKFNVNVEEFEGCFREMGEFPEW